MNKDGMNNIFIDLEVMNLNLIVIDLEVMDFTVKDLDDNARNNSIFIDLEVMDWTNCLIRHWSF